jgi:hypothetical protein
MSSSRPIATLPAASVVPAPDPSADPKRLAKLRAATVRTRLVQANDALAVADLLLGMNFSIASIGRTAR